MLCKIIESKEEGWLELAAAEYISKKLDIQITGTYASGAGSTQFTEYFTKVHTFRVGNELGRKLIIKDRSDGITQWKSDIQSVFSESELKLSGLILCISAVCHAAIASGLPLNQQLNYDVVVSRFKNYISNQIEKEFLSNADIRNLSNVIQHLTTIEKVMAKNSRLIFMRNIEIESTNYRITWSFGWYLELINQLNWIDIKLKSLNRYRRDQLKLDELGQEISGEIKAANVSNTATGQVLLDIEQTAEILLKKGHEIELEVTPNLKLTAISTEARLEGLELRFKTKSSLIRKLKFRLKRLMLMNTPFQLYIPRLRDIFHEVDDVLRYTVVTDRNNYTETIVSFLKNLKKEFDCEYHCFSFWAKNSTYLGINSFVSIGDFTFEIQFHTNESWTVKQSDSHDLYEGYRTLPYSLAKYVLYNEMKKI